MHLINMHGVHHSYKQTLLLTEFNSITYTYSYKITLASLHNTFTVYIITNVRQFILLKIKNLF